MKRAGTPAPLSPRRCGGVPSTDARATLVYRPAMRVGVLILPVLTGPRLDAGPCIGARSKVYT